MSGKVTACFPKAPPSPDEIKRHKHRRRRHAHAPATGRLPRLPPVTAAQMAIAARTPLPPDDEPAAVALDEDVNINTDAIAVVQLCVAMTSLVAMGFVMVVLERFV